MTADDTKPLLGARARSICVLIGCSLLNFPVGIQWYYGALLGYVDSYFQQHLGSKWLSGGSAWVVPTYLSIYSVALQVAGRLQPILGLRALAVLGNAFWILAVFLAFLGLDQDLDWLLYVALGPLGGLAGGTLLSVSSVMGARWFPSRVGLVSAVVGGAYNMGTLIMEPILSTFVNPDNVRADLVTAKGAYFTAPGVLERVPTMFLVLLAMSSGCFLLAQILIKDPPALTSADSETSHTVTSGESEEKAGHTPRRRILPPSPTSPSDQSEDTLQAVITDGPTAQTNANNHSGQPSFLDPEDGQQPASKTVYNSTPNTTKQSRLLPSTLSPRNNSRFMKPSDSGNGSSALTSTGNNYGSHSSVQPSDNSTEEQSSSLQKKADAKRRVTKGNTTQPAKPRVVRNLSTREVLRTPTFYYLTIGFAGLVFGICVVSTYYKQFGSVKVHDDHFLAAVGVVVNAFVIPTRVLWGIAVDRFRPKLVILVMCFLHLQAILFWYFTPGIDRWLYFITTVILQSVEGAFVVVYPAVVFRAFGPAHYATNLGCLFSCMAVLTILVPLCFQHVLNQLGYFWLFFFVAVSSLVSICLGLCLDEDL